jgi:hypothetical protein
MRSLDDGHARDARIFNCECLMFNDNAPNSTFIVRDETPSRPIHQLSANPSVGSPLPAIRYRHDPALTTASSLQRLSTDRLAGVELVVYVTRRNALDKILQPIDMA